MTINEYQKEAMRSVNPQSLNDQAKGLSNTALGLCGESGEVADMIKKHLHQEHGLDKEHMAKELGDADDDRFHKLLHSIFDICEKAGFRIDGRIVLVDKKSGRIWR